MPKRPFPFNNCAPLQLKTHVESKHIANGNDNEMQAVYAKTQSLLKAGAKSVSIKTNNNLPTANTVCQTCKRQGDSTVLYTTCSFCEKVTCSYCCNVCFNCEQNFCTLCSIISYDTPEEKSYCLSCCGS